MSTEKKKNVKNEGVLPRKKEKQLVKDGMKKKVTHPKDDNGPVNEDANGMTAKTLEKMQRTLNEVPHTSAATRHDKKAYE